MVAAPTSPTVARRRVGWWVLKLAVTASLFVWLGFRLDILAAWHSILALSPAALFVVTSLTGATVVLNGARWRRVLRHLGERVGLGALVADVLVGTTYNMLLPGSVGGDVIRAVRCGKRLGSTEHAYAAVLFERVLGLLSLAILAAIGVSSRGGMGRGAMALSALIAFALALVGLPALLHRVGAVLPGARATANVLQGPLARWPVRVEILLWSLASQLVSLGMLVVVAPRGPSHQVLTAVYFGVPLVLVLAIAPVSLGGLGLRESLFVAVLGSFGLSPQLAFTMSMVWLASSLATALGGALVMLAEHRR